MDGVKLELRRMLGLAGPVVLAELGWMALGVADTMMVGRLGAEPLGAVSVARVSFFTVAVFGMGLLFGLDTVVSTAWGAGRPDECHRFLLHGVYLSIVLGGVMTGVLWWGAPLLGLWGIDPRVLDTAVPYLRALSWSVLPLLLFTALRRYLQGVNVVRPVMIALISANLVNVTGNWLLIHGKAGFPALGAPGAGWSSTVAIFYLAVFLVATVVLHEREEHTGLFRLSLRPEPARLRRLLGLGFPAAGQMAVELGVFAAATALAGRLTPTWLAAHHVALTLASVTFMVPLGISAAAAVRVGQALGRGDPAGARRAGWTAMLLGVSFMALAAVSFLVVPGPLVRLFTPDTAVVTAGVVLLQVAAWFQLFDGLQVVATGALRGTADTRTPFLWNVVGHWVLGLPTGYYLCFVAGYGAVGLWVGWLVGLGVIAIGLTEIWRRRSRALVIGP